MLAVRALDHFALWVPDAERGADFYANFGLRSTSDGNSVRLDAENGLAGALYEGDSKRLHHLTFAIAAEDVHAFRTRLEDGGISLGDPPRDVDSDGIWFHDADGNLVELAVLPCRAPQKKTASGARVAAEAERGAPEGPARATPRRLGHTLLFSPDPLRQVTFYERHLGLRLSDRSGEIVAFMHTPHGSDHHVLAFGKSERPGFHHASFEVSGIDEIGTGAMYMQEKGHREGWGFGRHYIGSNYFYYIRDPWGSFAEYFWDIDFIPAGCAWEQRDVPAEHALFVWGPPPPKYFFENVEAVAVR